MIKMKPPTTMLIFILFVYFISLSESEWALLARYVYTYEEFVLVTEASRCNRMTATWHRQQNNIQIGNVQNGTNAIYNTVNYVWGLTCKFEIKKISMCGE